MKNIVEKKLSLNDVGATGAHQAGILIPKKGPLLEFFPFLDSKAENPRTSISFEDEYGKIWSFSYIYYNNKLRGGTRNEYRLTGMTAYLKQINAKENDILIFEKIDDDYYIKVKTEDDKYLDDDNIVSLVLDDKWKVIKC